MIRAGWTGLLLVFLFSLGADAQIKRELDLSSFSTTTRDKLYQRLPSLQEGEWTFADLDLLIQILIKEEQYDTARVVKEGENRYRVAVGKVRRISNLEFKGNSAISDSDIRRETGLAEKLTFDPSQLVEAGEKIRSLYEGLGYPQTQVDVQYSDSSPIDVNVTLTIREGPQTKMTRIQVQTPNADLRERLEKVTRRFEGDALTNSALADLRSRMRRVLADRLFWRTEIPDPEIQRNFEESEASLIFTIKNSYQYYFETEGSKRIGKSQLEDALQLDNYYSSNPSLAGELASKTRSYYLSQGYARVEVEGQEMDGAKPYTRRVLLKINEGPRIEIEKIEITGKFSEPQKHYVKFLKKHSSDAVDDDYYVKEDIDRGLKNLVTDRWNQGFLSAKVISTRSVYNKDRTRITLLINFHEGPLTRVQRITFEGVQAFPENELIGILKLLPGEPLRLSDLDAAILALKDHYRSHGYLEMSLQNEKEGLVTYNEDNSLGNLHFKIYEGPMVKVASILIEGNSLTRDDVIMKELEFKRGDVLTPQKLDESTSRLQRLGFFNSVEIKTLEEKTQVSERTVIIRVSDRDPGLFNAGFGANNEYGFNVRGFVGVAYRNIAGTGRGGSVRLEGNYNVTDIRYLERKVTVGYVEPYLFDSRVRGRLNLTRSIAVTDFETTKAAEVNQTTWSLEQDVTSNLLLVWDVLSIATIKDFYIRGNSSDNIQDIGSTAVTADLDYRNHPFNPTRGTFTRLNVEYGAPFLRSNDTIEYGRSYGQFTHYKELATSSNIVWANSIRGGYLQNLSKRGDGGVPYDKKGFYLGGQSTIRGFTPDEAFPNRFDFNFPDRTTVYKLTTSASMASYKSEVRFPIWNALGGAVFYDGGQVQIYCADRADCTSVTGWRDSIGLAVRYVTPVGAVSLEYGWKIRPKATHRQGPAVLHFSIGTF